MAIGFINGDKLNLDETFGLQPIAPDPTGPGGDPLLDTDVALADLQNDADTAAFYDRLFDSVADGGLALDPTFPSNGRAASQDGSVTVTSTGQLTGLRFTDSGGGDLDGDATDLLTLDGEQIFLFADTSLSDTMVLGKTADGTVVFAVFMVANFNADNSEASVDFHMVTFEPIRHPDTDDPDDQVDLSDFLTLSATEQLTFDFNDLPSGQNLFGIVGDNGDGLVIVPENPDLDADGEFTNISETTNTSKGGGPVTIGNSNQMIDPGEGFFFYYVENVNPDFVAGAPNGLDQNEADDADNIDLLDDDPNDNDDDGDGTIDNDGDTIDVDAAFFDIVQVQGNKPVSLTVSAFLLPDDASGDPVEGRAFVNTVDQSSGLGGTEVDIIQVKVYAEGDRVNPIVDTTVDGDFPTAFGTIGVTFDGVDGTVSLTGLTSGMRVEWFTDGLHNLSLVHGDAGKFDIGQFGINQPGDEFAAVGQQLVVDDDGPGVAGNFDVPIEEDDLQLVDPVGGNDNSQGIDEDDSINTDPDVPPDGLPEDRDVTDLGAVLAQEVGADEPLRFELDASATGTLPALKSKGDVLSYAVTKTENDPATTADDVWLLTATANDGSGPRTVFTWEVTSDGIATFILRDQLDHVAGDGENELLLVDGGDPIGNINLTSILRAFDGDNDPVPLIDLEPDFIRYFIEDDVPDADDAAAAITATVVEDSLDAAADAGDDNDDTAATDDLSTGIDELARGADGDEASGATDTADDLRTLFLDGADEDLTTSLKTNLAAGDLPTLFSKGDAVSYNVNAAGDTLTATAGGRTVFTLVVNADGSWSFDLDDQLDHKDGGDGSFELITAADGSTTVGAIDFSPILVGTDFDGDSKVGVGADQFTIKVENDVPAIGPIANITVDFAAGDSDFTPLNEAFGADEDPSFTITSFTGQPGDDPIVVNDVTLTAQLVDGTKVLYYQDNGAAGAFDGGVEDVLFYTYELIDDDDGDGIPDGDDAEVPGDVDDIIDSAKFTVHVDPPPAVLEFDFDDLPSGQNLFGIVGTTETAIVVFGSDPDLNPDGTMTKDSDTVNTSKGGGPTTIGLNNQMIDPGEDVWFTYVNDPVEDFLAGGVNGLDQNEADDADNMQYTGGTLETSSAFFDIVQVQGNEDVTLHIETFNIAGAPQGQDLANLSDISQNPLASRTDGVDITAVRIFAEGDRENPIEVLDLVDGNNNLDGSDVVIMITTDGQGDQVATISNLESGMRVEWTTDGDHDQVNISGDVGKFDIGKFGIAEAQPTPDQVLDFTVEIEDFDGDTDSASHKVGIDGTGPFDDDFVDFNGA